MVSKDWDDNSKTIYNMSCLAPSDSPGFTYLINNGLNITNSSELKKFLQENHEKTIKNLSNLGMYFSETDTLNDLIGKIDLYHYITEKNNNFTPKKQERGTGTCYAHAVATTIHLALHRIIGRKIPSFEILKDEIISEYGKNGAYTEKVLEKKCKDYRLQYKKINEFEARDALNKKRPSVAKFNLSKEEWALFSDFYKNNPKGILEKSHLKTKTKTGREGHAVVLIRCNPSYLTFLNSWGTSFADGGFFKVKDESVLNLKFYDIFWTIDQLLPEEKKAYAIYCKEIKMDLKEKLINKFPEVKSYSYKCPLCKEDSKIEEFNGNILKVICPKCSGLFIPGSKELQLHLYFQTYF